MPIKNDFFTLDRTDFLILKALQEDAKQTYASIGKGLGIAHSTVYDRIRKLEQCGIIEKYVALISAEKVGAKSITAIMTIYTDPKESEAVAENLAKVPEIIEVYTSVSEELLIIARAVAENQECLHALIANSIAPLSGVLRIRTSILTKKFKEEQFMITETPRAQYL